MTTEQQATPNTEKELREKVRYHIKEHGIEVSGFRVGETFDEATDAIMQLIQQEIEKAKLEARLEELQMLIGSGVSGDKYRTKSTHVFQTIQERIEELSKLQEEEQ